MVGFIERQPAVGKENPFLFCGSVFHRKAQQVPPRAAAGVIVEEGNMVEVFYFPPLEEEAVLFPVRRD